MTLGSKLAHMLDDREEAVLGRLASHITVLVKDSNAQRWRHDTVWNCEDLIKVDEVFHLDRPVREDKAFKLDAESARQLAEELLMRSPHIPPVVLVVMDSALVEVAIHALLQGLASVARDLQVQDEERFVRDRD